MNRIRKLNALSDANPGKTLLVILAAFAIACALLPADQPYTGVIAGVAR